MEPIQINVQVNIGLTNVMRALLESIFTRQQPTEKASAEETPAQETGEKVSAENKPQPEQAEETPAQETGEKEYTEVDVRAAMDATRRRIEGEDYKEKTDSEGYRKWHRALTAWFKSTAIALGSDKPSALPDSESRAKFIAACEGLGVVDEVLTENAF